jgi:hypothetical protein
VAPEELGAGDGGRRAEAAAAQEARAVVLLQLGHQPAHDCLGDDELLGRRGVRAGDCASPAATGLETERWRVSDLLRALALGVGIVLAFIILMAAWTAWQRGYGWWHGF